MYKTFKFKAKMKPDVEVKCNEWLGLCCDLYNASLEHRRAAYNKAGKNMSRYDQSYELPAIKKEMPEFKVVNSQVLQQVLERTHKAYDQFFNNLKKKNGMAGLPRFKSKSRYKSFTMTQTGWRLDGNYLHITNVGKIKVNISREIKGSIKRVTLKKDSCGDWWVYFSCQDVPWGEFQDPTHKSIGIDMGIDSFVTDSSGRKIKNPKHFNKLKSKLRKQQRKLARRKLGSKRRNKARHQVAKTHRKISDQRLDFCFKTARKYVSENGILCVEKLNVLKMMENERFSFGISTAGWGQFRDILLFKAAEAGRVVIEVNPAYTSQDCSGCGFRVEKDISERIHWCPRCDLKLDRDVNAAINLLQRGLGQSLQALTCGNSQSVA